MKKLILVTVLLLLASSYLLAQGGTVTGNTSYIPTVDTMGAHENGGRGCAGCHAPHSGGRGSGGNIISGTGAAYTPSGTAEGDNGLWGTDTNPIQTGNGGTITFDGAYPVSLAGLVWNSGPLYTGVATCLSCHDGNVSTGAMMSGTSYEQTFGLLNFSSVSNLSAPLVNATLTGIYAGNVVKVRQTGIAGPALYGNQPIPTLLGNDFGVIGDYTNDHPLGPAANMVAVGEGTPWSAYGVTFTSTAPTNSVNYNAASGYPASVTVTVAAGSPYANMVATYGYPAFAGLATFGASTDGSTAFLVCTTCHDQHRMNVYQSNPTSWSSALQIGGKTSTGPNTPGSSFQTIFFVNGPYNPGAPYDPTHLPSTMRFCQQCHFSLAPEAYGATNIGTAF